MIFFALISLAVVAWTAAAPHSYTACQTSNAVEMCSQASTACNNNPSSSNSNACDCTDSTLQRTETLFNNQKYVDCCASGQSPSVGASSAGVSGVQGECVTPCSPNTCLAPSECASDGSCVCGAESQVCADHEHCAQHSTASPNTAGLACVCGPNNEVCDDSQVCSSAQSGTTNSASCTCKAGLVRSTSPGTLACAEPCGGQCNSDQACNEQFDATGNSIGYDCTDHCNNACDANNQVCTQINQGGVHGYDCTDHCGNNCQSGETCQASSTSPTSYSCVAPCNGACGEHEYCNANDVCVCGSSTTSGAAAGVQCDANTQHCGVDNNNNVRCMCNTGLVPSNTANSAPCVEPTDACDGACSEHEDCSANGECMCGSESCDVSQQCVADSTSLNSQGGVSCECLPDLEPATASSTQTGSVNLACVDPVVQCSCNSPETCDSTNACTCGGATCAADEVCVSATTTAGSVSSTIVLCEKECTTTTCASPAECHNNQCVCGNAGVACDETQECEYDTTSPNQVPKCVCKPGYAKAEVDATVANAGVVAGAFACVEVIEQPEDCDPACTGESVCVDGKCLCGDEVCAADQECRVKTDTTVSGSGSASTGVNTDGQTDGGSGGGSGTASGSTSTNADGSTTTTNGDGSTTTTNGDGSTTTTNSDGTTTTETTAGGNGGGSASSSSGKRLAVEVYCASTAGTGSGSGGPNDSGSGGSAGSGGSSGNGGGSEDGNDTTGGWKDPCGELDCNTDEVCVIEAGAASCSSNAPIAVVVIKSTTSQEKFDAFRRAVEEDEELGQYFGFRTNANGTTTIYQKQEPTEEAKTKLNNLINDEEVETEEAKSTDSTIVITSAATKLSPFFF